MISRRSLLRAIPALLAAPAIVRVASLMPISVQPSFNLLEGYEYVVDDALTTALWSHGEWLGMKFVVEEVLPLARKLLVTYQFGDPLTLPVGAGNIYVRVYHPHPLLEPS